VTPKTWDQVQKLLTAKNVAGERQREHPHYLKGSIYCGQCGSRLILCNAKGNGGTYPYFVCIGRQRDKTSCKQRAIHVEKAEHAVAAHYATVQIPSEDVERLRSYLGEQLTKLRQDAGRERAIQERRLHKLDHERKKLLDAHYADAIPLDLLKSEQSRIATEVATIEGRLVVVAEDFEVAETNLQRALTRVGDCAQAYAAASGKLRRQFNLAFFKRLLIDDDYNVDGELAEPFEMLLGEELRRAVVAQEAEELRDSVEEALRRSGSQEPEPGDERPQEAEEPLVGARSIVGPPLGDGFSTKILVRLRGLEPPPGFPDTDLNRARLPIPPQPRAVRKRRYRTGPRPSRSTTSETIIGTGGHLGGAGNGSPKATRVGALLASARQISRRYRPGD
jgi:site-specific DNA recombinase